MLQQPVHLQGLLPRSTGMSIPNSFANHAAADLGSKVKSSPTNLMTSPPMTHAPKQRQVPFSVQMWKLGVDSWCRGQHPFSFPGPAGRKSVNRPANTSTGTAALILAKRLASFGPR